MTHRRKILTKTSLLTITTLLAPTNLAQRPQLDRLEAAVMGYRTAADPDQPAILIGKNDHKVSMEDSLSTDQITFLQNIMEERKSIEMGRDLGELVRMAFWYAVLNRKEGFEFAHDVPLEESMAFFSSNITGHGCYCWPDGKEKINGFGPRKDALDDVCFSLYNCYRCVNMQNGCGTTDWVTFAYGCAFADEDQDGQIELKCTDSHGSCGRLLCECDLAFASTVKHALHHVNREHTGIFPDGCPRAQGFSAAHAVNHKKECCGLWPHVKPYPVESHCCGADDSVYKIDSNPGRTQCIAQDQDIDDMGMEHAHASNAAAEDFELNANSQMDLFLQHQKFHVEKPEVDGTQTHDNFHSSMDRALVDLERRLEEPKESTPDF